MLVFVAAVRCSNCLNGVVVMQDIRVISLAVFAASFLIGFTIFQANKIPESSNVSSLQLSMVPLFSSTYNR